MFGCTLAYLTFLYTDYAKAPHFGAVAVFLAWMELTLLTGRQISIPALLIAFTSLMVDLKFNYQSTFMPKWNTFRFPAFGIYVYMSVHVTKMLVAFLLFYATFLLGFTFAFHLLLPDNAAFDTPYTSFMKARGA